MFQCMVGRAIQNVVEPASHIIQISPGDGDYKMFAAVSLLLVAWIAVREVNR